MSRTGERAVFEQIAARPGVRFFCGGNAGADPVVTLGCGGACPVPPGIRYLDWTVPDPADRPSSEVRRIRNELDLLVTDLLTTITC